MLVSGVTVCVLCLGVLCICVLTVRVVVDVIAAAGSAVAINGLAVSSVTGVEVTAGVRARTRYTNGASRARCSSRGAEVIIILVAAAVPAARICALSRSSRRVRF